MTAAIDSPQDCLLPSKTRGSGRATRTAVTRTTVRLKPDTTSA